MLSGRHARRDHASRSFNLARFLPFAVLLSATKSLILSIHFSLLFLCKRRSNRLNTGSSRWTISLQLWVAELSDLRRMYSMWSYMVSRLCVNMGVVLCRLFHISRFMLWRLRVLSMSSAGCRRFATTRSRLG